MGIWNVRIFIDVGVLFFIKGGNVLKCAILTKPETLEITQRPLPICNEYDVVVKVDTCGVCRTDRKAFSMGQRDLVLPRILGHEITGTVARIGSKVTSFAVGNRVQVAPGLFCGECCYCTEGLDHLCQKIQIIGFHLDGGFCQYIHIPGKDREPVILNELPADLDMETASLTEPLACCINLQKRLALEEAKYIVIFGAGPLGILSAMLARVVSKAKIIMIESHPHRLKIASQYCDYPLSTKKNVLNDVKEITKGVGADVVIPCCPGNEAFLMGLSLAAKRGRFGFFSGLVAQEGFPGAILNLGHYRELEIIGAYGCSLRHNREALKLLASRKVDVRDIASLTVSWQELPRILSQLKPDNHIFTYFKPH